MRYDPPRLLPAGDSALLIEFGDTVDLAINAQVHALASALHNRPLPGLGEAVPTYRSLLLHYDAARLSYADVAAHAREVLGQARTRARPEPRLVDIPTCYGAEFGPDLEFVARHNDLSPQHPAQQPRRRLCLSRFPGRTHAAT